MNNKNNHIKNSKYMKGYYGRTLKELELLSKEDTHVLFEYIQEKYPQEFSFKEIWEKNENRKNKNNGKANTDHFKFTSPNYIYDKAKELEKNNLVLGFKRKKENTSGSFPNEEDHKDKFENFEISKYSIIDDDKTLENNDDDEDADTRGNISKTPNRFYYIEEAKGIYKSTKPKYSKVQFRLPPGNVEFQKDFEYKVIKIMKSDARVRIDSINEKILELLNTIVTENEIYDLEEIEKYSENNCCDICGLDHNKRDLLRAILLLLLDRIENSEQYVDFLDRHHAIRSYERYLELKELAKREKIVVSEKKRDEFKI